MQNVSIKRDGRTLILTVDLDAVRVPSASGKTECVASTRGNLPLVDGDRRVYIGLNVYAYPDGH
jgi:hypothetical protein